MSTEAWLGWLAWGVVVFCILWWNQGRREARAREQAHDLARRAHRARRPAPPQHESALSPPPQAPASTMEAWVDTHEPTLPIPPARVPWAAGTSSPGLDPAEEGARQEARALLRAAIARQASVRFRYTDRAGESTLRTVRPSAITRMAGTGDDTPRECVVGFCELRQEQRAFRLDRIRDLDFLG